MTKKTPKTKPAHLKKATKKCPATAQQTSQLALKTTKGFNPLDMLLVISVLQNKGIITLENADPYEDSNILENVSTKKLFNDISCYTVGAFTKHYMTDNKPNVEHDFKVYVSTFRYGKLVDENKLTRLNFINSLSNVLKWFEQHKLTKVGQAQKVKSSQFWEVENFLETLCILQQEGYLTIEVPQTIDREKIVVKIILNANIQVIKNSLSKSVHLPIIDTPEGLKIYTIKPYVKFNNEELPFKNFNSDKMKYLIYLLKHRGKNFTYQQLYRGARLRGKFIESTQDNIKNRLAEINKIFKDNNCPIHIGYATKNVCLS